MRLLCLFFLFIISQNGIAQNNFKFDESSYKTLIERSKEENKPIFLMLYATWCPHCAKMKSEVFTDASVANLLDSNYICASQDTDKPEGIMLRDKFKTSSLPSFLFLDSNGNVLYQLKGEYNTANFIAEIKNALNPKNQLPYLEKEFLADSGNIQKCMNYIQILRKGKERTDLSATAHQYLATQSAEQLLSEPNWVVISNGVTDIKSREFQYVLQHQKEFEAVVSPKRVNRKITNIVVELLKPFTIDLDTLNYKKQREIAKTIHSKEIDSLIFSYDCTIYERTTNWPAYKKATIENTAKYVWNDPAKLQEIAMVYLKNIDDSKSIQEAIKWSQQAITLNDIYDQNFLCAQLFEKIKNKKMALHYALKAKSQRTAYNFSTKEVDDFLLKLAKI